MILLASSIILLAMVQTEGCPSLVREDKIKLKEAVEMKVSANA
jgi:hypothetical protein